MKIFFYQFDDLHWNHSYVSGVLGCNAVTGKIELDLVVYRKFRISFGMGFIAPHIFLFTFILYTNLFGMHVSKQKETNA